MDRLSFLHQRTAFIRRFYEAAAAPFAAGGEAIEARQEPLGQPRTWSPEEPTSGGDSTLARSALDLLGQLCVSLLSASLQLYLKGVTDDRGLGTPADDETASGETGWISRYRVFFTLRLGIDWARSPSDLSLLEELVLARPRLRPAPTARSASGEPSPDDRARVLSRVFADPRLEPWAAASDDSPDADLLRPAGFEVTGVKLFAALDQVDAFGEWLDRSL